MTEVAADLAKAWAGKATSPYTDAFTSLVDGEFTLQDVTSVAGAAMTVLGWVTDPFGSFAGVALGPLYDFLANNCVLISKPLDWVAGDKDAIAAQSEAWLTLAKDLAAAGATHAGTVNDLPSWSQAGAETYHLIMKDVNLAFQGAATQCASISEGIQVVGSILAGVRSFIWDLVTGFISSAVGNALAALAAAVFTAGTSIGAFTAWFSGKLAWVSGKISSKLADLTEALSKATSKWSKLSAALQKAADALRKIAAQKFASSGGHFAAASNRSGGNFNNSWERPQFGNETMRENAGKVNDHLGPTKEAAKTYDDQEDQQRKDNRPTTVPTI